MNKKAIAWNVIIVAVFVVIIIFVIPTALYGNIPKLIKGGIPSTEIRDQQTNIVPFDFSNFVTNIETCKYSDEKECLCPITSFARFPINRRIFIKQEDGIFFSYLKTNIKLMENTVWFEDQNSINYYFIPQARFIGSVFKEKKGFFSRLFNPNNEKDLLGISLFKPVDIKYQDPKIDFEGIKTQVVYLPHEEETKSGVPQEVTQKSAFLSSTPSTYSGLIYKKDQETYVILNDDILKEKYSNSKTCDIQSGLKQAIVQFNEFYNQYNTCENQFEQNCLCSQSKIQLPEDYNIQIKAGKEYTYSEISLIYKDTNIFTKPLEFLSNKETTFTLKPNNYLINQDGRVLITELNHNYFSCDITSQDKYNYLVEKFKNFENTNFNDQEICIVDTLNLENIQGNFVAYNLAGEPKKFNLIYTDDDFTGGPTDINGELCILVKINNQFIPNPVTNKFYINQYEPDGMGGSQLKQLAQASAKLGDDDGSIYYQLSKHARLYYIPSEKAVCFDPINIKATHDKSSLEIAGEEVKPCEEPITSVIAELNTKNIILNKVCENNLNQDPMPGLLLALTQQESSFKHCCQTKNKNTDYTCTHSDNTICDKDHILTNYDEDDNPVAIGIMQINVNQHIERIKRICGSLNQIYDLNCNILVGIDILKEKYETYKDGIDSELVDKYCEIPAHAKTYKTYDGWNAALRGYNGLDCDTEGADVDYVETINKIYTDSYKDSKCPQPT